MAAFVGLNPKQRQSGSSVQGRTQLSKIGDSNLRKAFYMPAITAKRYNPIIKAFCDRLELAGKPTMLIIGAAMRKLVHIIYGVLKSGKAFDANWAT
jgi:transposase